MLQRQIVAQLALGRGVLFASVGRSAARALSSSNLGRGNARTQDKDSSIEALLESWIADPESVDPKWRSLIGKFRDAEVKRGLQQLAATAIPQAMKEILEGTNGSSPTEVLSLFDTLRIFQLVRGYQMRGYLHARVDPLGLPVRAPFHLDPQEKGPTTAPDYRLYGFKESEMDKEFDCVVPGTTGFMEEGRSSRMTLRRLIGRLEETYMGSIGVEFGHIPNSAARNFIRGRMETPEKHKFSEHMRRRILIRTMRAQLFENFCAQKFSTAKRFGADGCESLVVAMKEVTKRATANGVENVVIGMPHRGRLNVLMNVMHKPMPKILNEFRGLMGFGKEEWGALGDVKYHLGVDYAHFDVDSQRPVHLTLLANPSHLEAVDPLTCGQARAKQYFSGDASMKKVLPVLFHGDAALASQGVVYETLQMSRVPGYTVGGTIHIVVNNQIGFTTNSSEAGSGQFCTSIARAVDAPVFHVNADDPEAVTFVAQLAFDYRHNFGQDVFINLVGYRRLGHNELDMPKFTQPEMYQIIETHPTVVEVYSKKLMEEGLIDQGYFERQKKEIFDFYNKQFEASKTYDVTSSVYEYTPQWAKMNRPVQIAPARATGVLTTELKNVGTRISTIPKGFNAHPTIRKMYDNRLAALQSGQGIDFGLAEALAYGTLLREGFHIRLAGQDAQRGTFSHRHAVLHDQTNFETYTPISALETAHQFHIYNSPLSEYAAMGFELGYSLESPDILSIWEAQFGDFANGAQVIIDQFLASGEVKWARQCGLTLLLPHGYDGQGPEHTSCRVERFLQLCDDREDIIDATMWNPAKRGVIQKHNMQVVQPTTPANHFHVIRRQMHRAFRKPLIILSPKKLLKLRQAVSPLSEMAEGSTFQPYISDIPGTVALPEAKIERLIVCAGQLYYDLQAQREKTKKFNVAISRVEQLSPFPYDKFIDDVKRYQNVRSIIWAQDEVMNNGAWSYVSPRMNNALAYMNFPNSISRVIYVGRDVAAAPAVGEQNLHSKEAEIILRDAFDLNRDVNSYYEHHTKN